MYGTFSIAVNFYSGRWVGFGLGSVVGQTASEGNPKERCGTLHPANRDRCATLNEMLAANCPRERLALSDRKSWMLSGVFNKPWEPKDNELGRP